MSSPTSQQLQVYFLFDRSGQWPPVPSEGIHAQSFGDGTYRLLETPFFVRNVALADVVSADDDGSGVLGRAGDLGRPSDPARHARIR